MTSSTGDWREEARHWLRDLWPTSRLFRVTVVRQRAWGENWIIDTDDGRFWFKSPHPRLRSEAALREVLERHAPRDVQPMHAHHPAGWIVSADAGASLATGEGDPTVGLAEALGRIQRATPLAELTKLPLRVFDPEHAAHNLAQLLDGIAASLPGNHPLRPDKAEREAACAAMWHMTAWWVSVDPGLPLGIEHNDLHPGNTFPGPRIADWGDAVIAHPFASMRVLLHHARDRRATADAYLRGWGDPEELHEPLEVAVRLAAVQRLATWAGILDADLATRYAHHIRPLWLETGREPAVP
ncbi:hypothetical protein EII34_11365 [Arachnia propionica]|uniref:Aminoglycoside phosphotransferase domain-containing protein n=1 Tax=Arachnia propionica TaxID=1750 RepID=A0A3P1T5W4_9ACTN|nr:hypothetical protein [Arachnia propionica]RRD04196.1 hypothetical protein EII34_11365 [Arachnia propionica]